MNKDELKTIFYTQNIRYIAFYNCFDCNKKRCDDCIPKTVVSKKFEIFKL